MKKADIHIGGVYIAKVSGRITEIRIESECNYGGWLATNLKTGYEIRVRSAQRLRKEVVQVQSPFAVKT